MPFKIIKSGNEYCVVNSDTNAKRGCHPNRAAAKDQLKAVYANVPQAGVKDFNGWVFEYQIDQKDAEYDSMAGMSGDKACANCAFFDSPNGCLVVRGDISPTGKSRFWEPVPLYEPEAIPVELTNWDEMPGQAGADPTLLNVAQDWFKGLFNKKKVEPGIKGLRPIYTTKDSDGSLRAHLIVSNNFEDRHGQTIPEVVHQQAIDFLERSNLHPEFQIWHMGTKSRWGQSDCITRIGNFTVFSGPVDPGKEPLAEAFANDPNTGVSNGYYAAYTPDRKDFMAWYPYEASALPVSHTANVWACNPDVLESEGYLMKAEHKAILVGKGVPEDFLAIMEKDILEQGTRVTASGVGSKATEEVTPVAETTPELSPDTKLMINAVGTAIGSAVKPIYERLDALEQGQKSIGDQQKKTTDDLVAEQILSRVGAGQGFKATESPNTIIDPTTLPDQALDAKQEWLGGELDKILEAHGVAVSTNGAS